MSISKWIHAGTILKMDALNYPDKPGCQDKDKSFTFREWNERTCRLADALTKTGVIGIKVAILSPDVKLHDNIELTDEIKNMINREEIEEIEEKNKKNKKRK